MSGRISTISPWTALAVALGVQTAIACAEQGIPILTVFVKEDLGISAAIAGLIVSSFNIGKVVGAYAGGRAADRLGERLILFVGGILTGAFVILGAAAPLAALPLLLCAGGVFAASSTPAGGRLVLVAFPYRQRAFAMGIRQAGIPVGGLVAALVLPGIAHAWGWRLALGCAGAIAIGVTVVLAIVTRKARYGGRAGARLEPATDALRSRLSRDPDLRLLTLWGCILMGGQYVVLTFLALDLHVASDMPLHTAAMLIAVAQAGGVAGRVLWGMASDRLFDGGRKWPLVLITLLALATAAGLAVLPRPIPLTVAVAGTLLAGLSLAGWQGLWVTTLAEVGGPARAGAATGFALTFVSLAIALSPPLYGLVIDLAESFRLMWAALAATLVVALAVVARLADPSPAERSPQHRASHV